MTSALSPLVLKGVNNTADDIVCGNIAATFERGYQALQPVEAYQGPVSIVGAGQSLSWTYKDIVGDIIACNSAHDFLIGKGIIPKYAMIWDANPIMAGIIKAPHPEVTYLVASRCHPSVFEKLRGAKVLVWHALGAEDNLHDCLVKYQRMEPMIAGGSSSVTRATHVAAALGYTKEMHLFGVCDDGKSTHVIGSLIEQKFIKMRVCGRWWKVAPWMAMQAGDFKSLVPVMKRMGVELTVHGKGLIPYIATFLDVKTPDIRVSWFEKNIRRPIHSVLSLYTILRSSNPQILGGSYAG